MTIDRILRDISEEDIAPFYYLYGSESFYRLEIVQALNQKLITSDNRDFNLENFNVRETSVGDWVGAARTLSFLGGIKLLVIRNLHETILKDSDQKMLLDYITDPTLDSCLVITSDRVNRKQKFFKTLTSQKGAILCEAPNEAELVHWIKLRAKSLGYELKFDVARKMVELVGAKPGLLAKELEKVITYAGETKTISESIVGELVGELKMENAFALTEAIKAKKTDKALSLLKNQLDHGEDPVKVLGLIAWQYRTLWEVKYYQAQKLGINKIAQEMGAKPFIVEKACQYTKNFNRATLADSIKNLFEADWELKTSGKSPQSILESLLLRLCLS